MDEVTSTPLPTPRTYNGHLTDCQNINGIDELTLRRLYTPRTYEGKEYYGAEDVAKIIGVTKPAVIDWHKKGLFTADARAHDGRYLYDVERVMQLKSVYHPKWMRGGYEPSPTTQADNMTRQAYYTYDTNALNNISPAEMEAAGLLIKSPHGERAQNHGYCCVYCPSGTGKNQSGALNFDFKGDHWAHYCQACGNGGDNLKFFQHVFNADFQDACKQASDMFGISYAETDSGYVPATKSARPPLVDNSTTSPSNKFYIPEKTDPAQVPIIKADIADAQKFLDILPDDQRRGLFLETFQHFGCGFAPRWTHPVTKLEGKNFSSPRIIIPTADNEHYNAVALDRDRKLNRDNPYFKAKMHAGRKTQFFNENDLLRFELIIFVEGEIDAMSIWQVACLCNKPNKPVDPDLQQFGVVATLGTSGWERIFMQKLDAGYFPWRKYLILFDNDAGRTAAEQFKTALIQRNLPAVVKFFDDFLSDKQRKKLGDKIDANKILTTLGNYTLRELVTKIVDDADKEFGDIHNQINLDFNANSDTDISPPVVVADNNPYADLIDKWQQLNGKINPVTLPKIIAAHELLTSFNADNLTPDVAISDQTKNAVALCNHFGFFINDVQNFFVLISKLKVDANAAIKINKQIGTVINDSDFAWENLSVRELKKDISSITAKIAREHKKFGRDFEKQRAADENAKQKITHDKILDQTHARLDELRQQSPSPERNAEIIRLLLDNAEWKLNNRGDRIAVKATAANLNNIFTFDPNIDGLFGYDQFQQTITFLRNPAWAQPEISRVGKGWGDVDDAELRHYIRSTYTDFNGEKMIYDALISYANLRVYNEVKDFIKNLPPWDGTERAATVFIKFLGADDTPFNRAISLNWLLGMMARLFFPGVDYSYCLVLQGAQGIGKSRLLEMLAGRWGVNPNGRHWHGSIQDQIGDPHVIDAIQNLLIGELEEGVSVTRSDIRALKAFLSAKSDNRRFSYEKRARDVPRHCVFALTTNEKSFLRDQTGNRRFMVLKCTDKTLQRVYGMTPEYIRQVLAEAHCLFQQLIDDDTDLLKDNSKLMLPKEFELQNELHNDNYLVEDGLQNEFAAWVNKKILPEFIWQLLERGERARFCVDGFITLINGRDELCRRRRIGSKKNLLRDIDAIIAFCKPYDEELETGNPCVNVTRALYHGKDCDEFTLYGSEYRQHICPAEVFAEAFPNSDKRKSVSRINELFNALESDGWQRGKRFCDDDKYPNQRKVLYRVSNDDTQDEPDTPSNDDLGGKPVADEDLPF